MTAPRRYRLDDLRRLASSLAAGAGVAPARAAALASHLLWFDAAGAARHGIATLADCLDRIASGTIDPGAVERVTVERPGTAVLDGRRGVPLLVLDRAAGLAVEKARDTGIGLVRVLNAGPVGSAAGVAAEIAIGPMAAVALGPGSSLAVALPSEGGLPAVFDPSLAAHGKPGRNKATPAGESLRAALGPWVSALVSKDDWLVVAASVPAIEPLSTFHERLAEIVRGLDESEGRLLPGPWDGRRREAQAQGVLVDPAAWKGLLAWAARFGVPTPEPLTRHA